MPKNERATFSGVSSIFSGFSGRPRGLFGKGVISFLDRDSSDCRFSGLAILEIPLGILSRQIATFCVFSPKSRKGVDIALEFIAWPTK